MMLIINMRTSVGEITVVRYIAQDQDYREGQKNFATFFSKLQLHPVISQIKFPLSALKSPICKNISDTKTHHHRVGKSVTKSLAFAIPTSETFLWRHFS